ncbi:SDR family NAD(P)-dependent oxidoreductase [Siphonobacter sp. SORGH_AS_1065]|uniref:SDR family NAD(P)-dependent oxidoreductase n=1 Tax=Siphonobacter sp. SORGH_AS_1065 TaxID=3041795 RepID=UPI002780E155|nr:SDR family oxidoreductase [Siphonobacter sp. SORGH_AS_1065]MDQ1087134.1 3-oxoacyl-[acyl-carrier protein] reductase [Siphonobacter sp. SORGH_AS_1065]
MKRKVIITGAAGGIGKGIAAVFAQKEYELVIVDRNNEQLQQTQAEFIALNPALGIQTVVTDLSTPEGKEYLYTQVPETDVLVNNVGYYENIDFFDLQEVHWQKMIDLNFMIGMQLSQVYFRKMLDKKKGRLIFISSESAINPDSEKIHYCVAKTMLLSLSRNLAELTKNTEVTVNCILPGPALTTGTEKFVTERYSPDLKEAERKFMASRPTSIIGRLIRPEEIGNAAVFLADENSGAINGSNLRVEGGIVTSII